MSKENLQNSVCETLQNEVADFHTLTAARAYGIKPAEVSREQRLSAKAFNYGRFYSMTPEQLFQILSEEWVNRDFT